MTKIKIKKKRIFFKKINLMYLSNIKNNLIYFNTKINKDLLYLNNSFKNIFRIIINNKQLFFSLLNNSFTFAKQFSSGQLLSHFSEKFKFFKKTIKAIFPLILQLKKINENFYKKLYILEILNFSKKTNIFLKRFIKDSSEIQIKYFIFKKSFKYVTKPKKRIKRKIIRLIGKI